MSDELNQVTKVDLDSLDGSLVQEIVEINLDSNPMEAPPPVGDGTHRVKLMLKDDSFEHRTTKGTKTKPTDYISCQFSGAVIAEGTRENNKRVFGRINTLSFDGKSVMAYILLQMGGGKANTTWRAQVDAVAGNYVDLAKLFKKTIAGEPIIRVSTRWVARYNAGTKEDPDYKTALSGMNNFPSDGQGGRRPFVVVPKVGEVPAQAEIQDYFPDVATATA